MKNLLFYGLFLLFTNMGNVKANETEFLKVEQAFAFSSQQENDILHINFDIAPGYYLYKEKLKIKFKNAKYDIFVLPEGEIHQDEFFGEQAVYRQHLAFDIKLTETSADAQFLIRYQGCADAGLCYPPKKHTLTLTPVTDNSTVIQETTKNTPANSSEQFQLENVLSGDSLLWSLAVFFVIGIGLSFTPCVFPMYPILTGMIVGQGDKLSTKKAFTLSFFYVQGMAITYTLLGVVVAFAGLQFQAAFQHPIVLISLSVLFVFLALSMFGIFNLSMPSSWQTKLNQLSNSQKGGSLIGVIMMGVISGLVASPCTTAPLTAALLYIAKSGDLVLGASALYALSLGMGLPLIILGTSGGKLLPKAGNWMNIIKNIFGFLLLMVPVFLLERILPELVSQLLWIVLLLAFATYLYVNNTKGKSDLWYGARSLVIFLMLFTGAKQGYELAFGPSVSQVHSESKNHFKKVASLAELNQQIKIANAAGKTVLVDLYADWCIACKEFEKYTFFEPAPQKELENTVLLQIDLTDPATDSNVEIWEHFNILGLPSILLFDLQGNEYESARITGFMNAEQFTAHLKQSL